MACVSVRKWRDELCGLFSRVVTARDIIPRLRISALGEVLPSCEERMEWLRRFLLTLTENEMRRLLRLWTGCGAVTTDLEVLLPYFFFYFYLFLLFFILFLFLFFYFFYFLYFFIII